MPRFLRNFIKNRWKGAFELGQRMGFDLLPRHWYSSIPDFRELKRDDSWRKPYDMAGVRGAEIEGQFATVEAVMATPGVREDLSSKAIWDWACKENGEPGYGPADGDLLYGVIATRRPRKIIQVGCGVSTAMIFRAAEGHEIDIDLVCVDPYPTGFLKMRNGLAAAMQENGRPVAVKMQLIEKKAEQADPKELADLNSGDLLFIDSSHTTKPGSDVHHLFLRVLPILKPGVMIHVHDIHWPYDFSPNLYSPNDLFFGSEPALLHAFLIHNPRCRIDMSLSMLHQADPKRLATVLPNYEPFQSDRGLNPPAFFGKSPSAAWLMTE